MTIHRDLVAARNRAFDPVMELDYSGIALPLTGATVSIQVRLYAGAPGSPVFQQTGVTYSDFVSEADPALRTLRIEPNLPRAQLESGAVPSGLNKPEVGEADRFEYEIKLLYADSKQDILWSGGFYLQPGVNLL